MREEETISSGYGVPIQVSNVSCYACSLPSWVLICICSFSASLVIECFHMTSRRPYWCPKTMKRRPCWCPKPILWELNSFLMQTLSFVPINLHRCWSREWKHSIGEAPGLAGWKQSVPCYQTPQARALERRDTSTSKQHEKQQLPAARFTAWLCLSVTYPNNFMIRKYKINLWKLLFCCCSGNHRQKFYYGHKEIMIPGLSLKLFFVNNIQRYFRFLYLRVIFALC